jgi:hypothetical protein
MLGLGFVITREMAFRQTPHHLSPSESPRLSAQSASREGPRVQRWIAGGKGLEERQLTQPNKHRALQLAREVFRHAQSHAMLN